MVRRANLTKEVGMAVEVSSYEERVDRKLSCVTELKKTNTYVFNQKDLEKNKICGLINKILEQEGLNEDELSTFFDMGLKGTEIKIIPTILEAYR